MSMDCHKNGPPAKELEDFTRRRFVKLLAFGTAVSAVAGELWQRTLLADVEPVGANGEAVLKIRLSDYPPLQSNGGSVRLAITPISGGFGSVPTGDYYPIIINRDDSGAFYVLDSRCTHSGCVVEAYSPVFQGMFCFCHSSKYNFDGSIISGPNGPSQAPLDTHVFDFDGTSLTINMVNLTFSVTASVLSGANGRLALNFPTTNKAKYELSHRQRVQDPWVVVPFATTQAGVINQTSITGTGSPMTIFVDRANTAGVFAVGYKLAPV